MNALLLIDLENDFLPGGALAVKDGNMVIPIVNELVHAPFDLIVATKDWHPLNHCSFIGSHSKNPPGAVDEDRTEWGLWPVHCVQNTWGSEFAPGWDTTAVDHVFSKGTDLHVDSYSAFFDNHHLKETGLGDYLKEHQVKQVYIAGLATDYCVKYSVLDALSLGFETFVIFEACRGVNLMPNDSDDALRVMSRAGAKLISFSDLMDSINK
jgi:nicotinamidase/pyrazinamidase